MPSTRPIDRITVAGAPSQWRIAAAARRLAAALRRGRFIPPRAGVVLSVSVVGRARMAALNMRFRGRRAPTDILSFEQPGRGRGPRGVAMLGDLVLCAPVARAQAADAGHGVRDEVAVLLVHGLLHLLGYDHEQSSRGAREMARAEARLLRLSGLGARGGGQRAGLITRAGVVKRT